MIKLLVVNKSVNIVLMQNSYIKSILCIGIVLCYSQDCIYYILVKLKLWVTSSLLACIIFQHV